MYKSEYSGKGGIEAKVVAHSEFAGTEIHTLELKYPRFIHAEFMTHREFSRNASSSRAIPVEKLLKQIEEKPAMPIHWGKNQPGMQAREECTAVVKPSWTGSMNVDMAWQNAANEAAGWAEAISEAGYHKQIVNRLTEPFQFIKVIVTSTKWDNFFKLRLHEDAQPEIYELARCMFEAMENSDPDYLEEDEWHLPYIFPGERIQATVDILRKASSGRCARVSYQNHDNTKAILEKDAGLHDMLFQARHMSPFEHQAKPMPLEPIKMVEGGIVFADGVTHFDRNGVAHSGNFHNFIQYRQLL